jgi:hypothetical protein
MKAALAGFAVVAAHAAGFVALAARAGGGELAVEVAAPLASPQLALDGRVAPGVADRVEIATDRDGPGLRRRSWSVRYRGDFVREVAATQLVGPFQDPRQRACTGRVVVGQRLLDDGQASAGTIANAMAKLVDAELHGETIFPVGAYERVDHLSLRWARLDAHPEDRALVGDAPHGYVRATVTIVFARVAVPLVVALVPEQPMGPFGLPAMPDRVHFRVAARAELAFDSSVVQWLSDKLDANALATRLARRQIDDVLVTTLAPPPPFELPDGQTLAFTYCDGPVEIAEASWGALPFAVVFSPLPSAPSVLPPRFGPGSHVAPTADTVLAIDLDVDALDALLFELWRTGWLDRRLADVGLDRQFNTDPLVTDFLSIRLSPLRLALPPVIEPAPGALRLAADARVAIADGTDVTTGRVYGAADLHVRPPLAAAVDLSGLELACERTSTTLVPCYADLVAAIRDRGAAFHGALTGAFAQLLEAIFVDRRLGAPGVTSELAIRRAVPAVAPDGHSLHLDLDASLIDAAR